MPVRSGGTAMRVRFGVLGPVTAWDGAGQEIDLKGPRHRAVLARLIIARRHVVPVSRLVEDLWEQPPDNPLGAVRTFVAALRRALEPDRPPRTAPQLLVTDGPGYALHAEPGSVDAWLFEQAVADAGSMPPREAVARLEQALGRWRGPAYAQFADQDWARAERSRLAQLRLHAIERQAEARLTLGLAAEAAADLDAHAAEHPWREEAWRLLALALYRAGRQGDALAVLRRARTLLVEQLGADPGPALRALEADILRQSERLEAAPDRSTAVWAQATAAYERAAPTGARARLESAVDLLRHLAVTGGTGLVEARRHRVAAIAAAEELGDAQLTARVIGAYDVPAIWTRLDDPQQAAAAVAAAERTLAALPSDANAAVRARLLATVALESRGTRAARGLQAAEQAVQDARALDDPALLAFALNALFMQTFWRAGLAARRDGIGAELVELSERHGLATFQVLGRLVRMQARGALADFAAADRHAHEADRLAKEYELPLVGVFTQLYGALRLAASDTAAPAEAEAAYREAAARLDGAGMPGLEQGLLPLALLSVRISRGLPLDTDEDEDEDVDWGPYEPWARPLALLERHQVREAAAALRRVPEPPRDLLFEALWCLTGRAAIAVGDRALMRRAHDELAPAVGELAGAGSGLITLGPVARYVDELADALRALEAPGT